jgi:O-6-methylguanine DNA methyltransferase
MSSGNKDGVWFTVAVNERGQLMACSFSDRSRREAERVVKETVHVPFLEADNYATGRRLRELYRLFRGNGKVDLKSLDLTGVSDFRKRVYRQLCQIPRGRVTTYGIVAEMLGSRKSSRAVGSAVAANPLPLAIPCHRVVPSTLHVGNYGTPGGRPTEGGYMKRAILEREGVKLHGNRILKECLWSPRKVN